jgi:hypothetical protein
LFVVFGCGVQMTVSLALYNLTSQTAIHIHDGTLLTSGGVLYALPVGNLDGYAVKLSLANFNKMRAGGTYINVHTTANGGGEHGGVYACAALSSLS